LHTVANLDLVIQARAGADYCSAQRAAIYGGIGSHLDVVLNNDTAELRDALETFRRDAEAKTFLANPRAWVNIHSRAKQCVAHADKRPNAAIRPKKYTIPNNRPNTDDLAPRADVDTGFNHLLGAYLGGGVDMRSAGYDG
jgi:hypothetical protein